MTQNKNQRCPLQVYMDSSMACRFASPHWERAAKDLKGIARLARVQFAADPAFTAQLASAGSIFSALNPAGLQASALADAVFIPQ